MESTLAEKLSQASSREDAAHLVGEATAAKLAGIFMIPLTDIDLGKPPAQYGVDSLVAVESAICSCCRPPLRSPSSISYRASPWRSWLTTLSRKADMFSWLPDRGMKEF